MMKIGFVAVKSSAEWHTHLAPELDLQVQILSCALCIERHLNNDEGRGFPKC